MTAFFPSKFNAQQGLEKLLAERLTPINTFSLHEDVRCVLIDRQILQPSLTNSHKFSAS